MNQFSNNQFNKPVESPCPKILSFSLVYKLLMATVLVSCLLLSVEAQTMTTVAGILGNSTGAGNSIGVPQGVALDSAGNLFVADTGIGSGSVIYKITPGGVKTVYAGVPGIDGHNGDGTATTRLLNVPNDIWIDSSDNLYIADTFNRLIRRVTPAGALTTVAGVLGNTSGTGNSIGVPDGVAVDSAGNIYVANGDLASGSVIYRITAGGVKTIYAGVAGTSGHNGDGIAIFSHLNAPVDLWIDSSNNLYIADTFNRLIRRVTPTGGLTTVAGVLGNTTGTGNSIGVPESVAVDGAGNIYVANTGLGSGSVIYRITPGGVKTVYAGVPGMDGHNGDGTATTRLLNVPTDIYAKAGNLYTADQFNRLIRRIDGIAPTAASVNIQGRVTSAFGNPIRNAVITLTNGEGETLRAVTNPFGYYNLSDIPVGETYLFQIRHKQYQFVPVVLNITEDIKNLDFTALP